MRIRKARKEEAEKISHLIRNTILKVNSKHYPKKQMEFELTCYTAFKIKSYFKDKTIFCLLEKEEIIGVSILNFEEKTIESLYLNPKFIGKGLGIKLLLYVENYAKKKGIKKIILYPTDYALKFYQKARYKIIRQFIGTKNGGYPVTEMEKRLR
jgi:N-acetylglutamate synthase-like GNAT family acetyltransferase